jgi:tRNA(Ile)-lysidine synthase
MIVSTTGPITNEEFAALMARLGPFESKPEIAVAVSGGADSMAAAVLAHDWAGALNGRAVALTVDHGLRSESADEAALVRQRLSDLGIETAALVWSGDKPASNLQAEARRARYRLLADWCAGQGILHLVLGHHREDQAETFLLRLSRGSGLYGLAAMTALQELPDYRVLRPLLTQPKARLVETLIRRGVAWVEDPSNRDPKYARTRLRSLAASFAAEGLTAAKLADTAARLGRSRVAMEEAVSKALARSVTIHPAGIAIVDPDPLRALPQDTALRCLTRILTTISGAEYGPRMARLETLHDRISRGLTSGATLSGCRVLPWRQRLVVCRESRNLQPVTLEYGRPIRWDSRFDVVVRGKIEGVEGELRFGQLGPEGWAEVRPHLETESLGFPPLVGAAVPAVRDAKGVVAAPHLGYIRAGLSPDLIEKCRFRSGISLAGVAFTVA